MRKFIGGFSSCALLLALAVPAYAASARIDSLYSSHDVKADTDPGSSFWANALAVLAQSDALGKPVPGKGLEVRSRWTKKNLYFLFTCPYEQLNLKPDPKTGTETNQLWNWDVAEVFIGSDFKNIRRYREFEVSPQGEWIDLDIDLDTPHHEDGWLWNSGFQVAARIDPASHTWYGFMRIPYSAIDASGPSEGKLLRANFFLSEGAAAQRREFTWQPTHKATFHVPEVFGSLRLSSHNSPPRP